MPVQPTPSDKIIVFTAPSGAGKTTIVRHLLSAFPDKLAFSVSATTRKPRPGEVHGKDYHFLTKEDFKNRVVRGEFLEYEEVYKDQFYGTLNSEVDRIWASGKMVIFDVEVKGATTIKQRFPDRSRVIFVSPPSEEVLFERLRNRGTESRHSLDKRIARAKEELSYRDTFDVVLINQDLATAKAQAEALFKNWDAAPSPAVTIPLIAEQGIWLLVDFYIKPDKIEEAEALFRQHVADGRSDRGNLCFTMLRRSEDPTHFTSLECWAKREDIDNHDAQPHHPVFLNALAQLQAREKEVQFLDFFAQGNPLVA